MFRSGFKYGFDPSRVNGELPLRGARIIIVVGPLELGGAERQALLLARYLSRDQQADVEIWGTLGPPGRLAALCEEYGILWRIVPQPWAGGRYKRPLSLVKFAQQLRRARPDIILPYMTLPNMTCGLTWRWTGAHLCVWNQQDDGVTRLRSRYEPWAVRLTPWFTANSGHGADYLIKSLSAPLDRVRVVYNVIELPPLQFDRPAWRERLGVTSQSLVACMIASLSVYKDHVTLLKAWRLVVERMNAEGRRGPLLVLAGRFESTVESLKALAFDLDLGRTVKFLGEVTDISGLLGAVDLGVFSSVSEGSPNAVMECMAAGLAVAGTDIPALREALPPESHAFLAPPRNPQSLAAHILELFANDEVRARLGAANRRRIETEFSPRMCEETLAVIIEGLRERAG